MLGERLARGGAGAAKAPRTIPAGRAADRGVASLEGRSTARARSGERSTAVAAIATAVAGQRRSRPPPAADRARARTRGRASRRRGRSAPSSGRRRRRRARTATSRSSSRNQIAPSRSGRRERDGMEVVDDEPLGRRVEEVDEGEAEPGPIAAEMLPREQIDGNRAERDGDGLRRRAGARGSARSTTAERGGRRSGRSARRAGRSARR